MKTLRHDTDDVIAFPVQQNRFARNLRVRAEAALPQAVAHHDDVPAGGLIVFRSEDAAQSRIHFQN